MRSVDSPIEGRVHVVDVPSIASRKDRAQGKAVDRWQGAADCARGRLQNESEASSRPKPPSESAKSGRGPLADKQTFDWPSTFAGLPTELLFERFRWRFKGRTDLRRRGERSPR
jgi:hypothetical protein